MDQLPSRRRRRPALSCFECRRRKIRCDRSNPCGHCSLVKLRCEFPEYHGPPRSTPTKSPSFQLTRPSNEARPGNYVTPGNTLDKTAESFHSQTTPRTAPPAELGPCAAEGGSTELIMDKGRVMPFRLGIAPAFEPILACYAAVSGNTTYVAQAANGSQETSHCFGGTETVDHLARVDEILKKSKVLAREIKVSLCTPLEGDDFLFRSRDTADMMARLYFATLESTHRILHAGTFWAEYEKFWRQGENISTDVRLRVLLVIGLGSSLYGHADGLTRFLWNRMANGWLRSAETWLNGPLKGARRSLGGIQVHCLVFMARQIFATNDGEAWVATGSLVNEAMRAGLHRDPSHFPNVTCFEAEMRRRLWATVLELVAQSSLDSCMPPRISPDEFDTRPPANVNDSSFEISTTSLDAYPSGTAYTDTSLQLVLLESLPTRLRILQRVFGVGSDLQYPEVLSLSSEMIDACRNGNDFLRQQESESNAEMMAFRRNILDFLVRRFLLALHCPYATLAQENPLFEGSVKTSLDAAMSILSPEPNELFSRLLTVGGGLFKQTLRNAMMSVSLELLIHVERQRLDGTLHRSQQYRAILVQKLEEMIELSMRRISHGETNIKGPMFLNMILSQAEAGATGSPSSRDGLIARAARESLELCYGLLQVLADEAGVPMPPCLDDGALPSLTFSEDWDDAMGAMSWDFNLFFPQGGL